MLPHRFIGFPGKFSESSLHAPKRTATDEYHHIPPIQGGTLFCGLLTERTSESRITDYRNTRVTFRQNKMAAEVSRKLGHLVDARPFACNAPFPRQFAFLLLLPRCKGHADPLLSSQLAGGSRGRSRVSQHYLANSLSGVGEFSETCCADLKSPTASRFSRFVDDRWTATWRIIVSDIAVSWKRKTSRDIELRSMVWGN